LYYYYNSKENGINGALMNLPNEILQLVQWDAPSHEEETPTGF